MQINTPISLEELSNYILNKCYPVGSLYWTDNPVNPSTLLGGGQWTQIKDKFILAAGDTYKKGQTGGEATHALTIDEMPAHKHQQYVDFINVAYAQSYDEAGNIWSSPLMNRDFNGNENYWNGNQWSMNSNGGNQPHNNMPPYEVFYCWKRVQ
nr:MAG TPA: baseplate protein [Caudoviricetes sp.]